MCRKHLSSLWLNNSQNGLKPPFAEELNEAVVLLYTVQGLKRVLTGSLTLFFFIAAYKTTQPTLNEDVRLKAFKAEEHLNSFI